MIEISMTSPEGVTLATAGKYCPENVKVTPGFDLAENARRWTVEVVNTISKGEAIVSDPWLAAHRADNNLALLIIPHNFQNAAGSTYPGGLVSNMPFASDKYMQIRIRSASNGEVESYSSAAITDVPLTNPSSWFYINEQGQLLYNASSYLYATMTLTVVAFLM